MNQFFTRSLKTALFVALTILATAVKAADFKIVNLQAADMNISALNKTYTSGTSSVRLTTGYIEDNPEYDYCGPQGAVYFKSTDPSPGNYSYITIDNDGDDNITAVELFGVCAESGNVTSDIYVAFSANSSSETSDDDYSMNLYMNDDFSADPAIHFYSVAGGGCLQPAQKVTLPNPTETWYYQINGTENIISKVGSVKIALTTNFGIENTSNGGVYKQKRFLLQSLVVYTDKKGNTGIGEGISTNSFSSYTNQGKLNFTEPASQVSIYNVSGQLVQTAENIQILPLNTLPAGIYVVKATSTTGKTLVTKIAK